MQRRGHQRQISSPRKSFRFRRAAVIVAAKAALIRGNVPLGPVASDKRLTTSKAQTRSAQQGKRGSFLMKFARPMAAPVNVSVLVILSALLAFEYSSGPVA